jgi:hypothetical protein
MFDLEHGIVVFTWEGGRADFNRWTLSEPTVGTCWGSCAASRGTS